MKSAAMMAETKFFVNGEDHRRILTRFAQDLKENRLKGILHAFKLII